MCLALAAVQDARVVVSLKTYKVRDRNLKFQRLNSTNSICVSTVLFLHAQKGRACRAQDRQPDSLYFSTMIIKAAYGVVRQAKDEG